MAKGLSVEHPDDVHEIDALTSSTISVIHCTGLNLFEPLP